MKSPFSTVTKTLVSIDAVPFDNAHVKLFQNKKNNLILIISVVYIRNNVHIFYTERVQNVICSYKCNTATIASCGIVFWSPVVAGRNIVHDKSCTRK